MAASLALLSMTAPVHASTVLNSAQDFAVLGAAGITNTSVPPGSGSAVWGLVGVSPGSSATGFASLGVGQLHVNDGVAATALSDANAAYLSLAAKPIGTVLTGVDLGALGGALAPGVYTFASSAQLTGTLVLDFSSNPGGTYVFQIGSSLTTGTNAMVSVLNAGAGSSIYWEVGSSASLGERTSFAGNILAHDSVSFDGGAGLQGGRAFALGGQVTMIDSLITNNCGVGGGCVDGASAGYSGGITSAVPEPDMALMMLAGLGTLGSLSSRRLKAM